MLMKMGICDSDIMTVEQIIVYIKSRLDTSNIEFVKYVPEEVMFDIEDKTFECDIFITEIIFKDLGYDGISLAKLINGMMPSCKIIFYVEDIPDDIDVYEAEHINCIKKKDRDAKLIKALSAAIECLNSKKGNYVKICYGRTTNVFTSNEVICIKKEERLTKYYTVRGEYVQYISLTDAERILPEIFIRVNSGCIVNRQYIKNYTHSVITLSTDEVIKIGRQYKKKLDIK